MPRKYITQYVGGKGYTSPLHKFIDSTGRSYGTMTRKEIDSIGDLKQYQQWKRLQGIIKMLKKRKIEESFRKTPKLPSVRPPSDLDAGQFSNKYKHGSAHISRRALHAKLVNTGFSQDTSLTATKQNKYGRARPRVGKRAYMPIPKGHSRWILNIHGAKQRRTLRNLNPEHPDYHGYHITNLVSDYETENTNIILEKQSMEKVDRTLPNNRVNRLVSINKEQRNQEMFKIKSTLTGKSGEDTDMIVVNPDHNNEILKTPKT